MIGSLFMSLGILRGVRTRIVWSQTTTTPQKSAWTLHMLRRFAQKLLLCLSARSVRSWLALRLNKKACYWISFNQWGRCAELVKQKCAKDMGHLACSCASLMTVLKKTGTGNSLQLPCSYVMTCTVHSFFSPTVSPMCYNT